MSGYVPTSCPSSRNQILLFFILTNKIEIDASLSINGRYLKKVDYIKYIGVFIDSNLS